jgi:hypothetical protein
VVPCCVGKTAALTPSSTYSLSVTDEINSEVDVLKVAVSIGYQADSNERVLYV